MVLEKSFENPFHSKEIKPVNPKGNQFWIFIRGTYAQDEAQYFGHLVGRTDSLEKTLMLGKAEGRRRRGQQMMKLLDSITNLMDTSLSKLQEIVEHRGAWHATACGSQRAEQNLAIEQQMYDHPCQLGQ